MTEEHGFTLIELLVVCAILAAFSFLTWGAYADVDRRAEDELARTALLRLADALRRFHNDTGYWPGEGPFRLENAPNCPLPDGTIDSSSSDTAGLIDKDWRPTGAAFKDIDEQRRWFCAPANLALLFEPPLLVAGKPLSHLQSWNPQTQRGWHGPYLPLSHRHWADVGASERMNEGGMARDVPAFAAGPGFPPLGDFLKWRSLPSAAAGYEANRHDFRSHPRPLAFLLKTPGGDTLPRVVYWGADGRFGGTNEDDPCLPNAVEPDGKDDLALCL
ncbi:MAG: prepilin-type N-terminal cleavage/methylation domain-containing protein [Zoogloeaceae bacterium]|jgi:prepilin-type N-terminal cleavage/methylation domain-containing protein|nr:prepilin-type N-terminal cleavage/methylation domain-containing protein [Zoogloeaceae bacterium]